MRTILTLMLVPFLVAATYYVDPNGDDANDGSAEKPWKHVSYACGSNGATQPGDTVIIRDGIYYEQVDCKMNSGTTDAPITFRAENPGKAIIDGSIFVSTWTNEEDQPNLYRSYPAKLSDKLYHAILWRVGDETPYKKVKYATDLVSDNLYHYDKEEKVFRIYSTTDPNLSTFRAWTDRSIAFDMRGISHMTLDGVTVQYANIGVRLGQTGGIFEKCEPTPRPASNLALTNSIVQYASLRGVDIGTHPGCKTAGVHVDGNTIRFVNPIFSVSGQCVKISTDKKESSGEDVLIENNKIFGCWEYGIQNSIGFENVVIRDNDIFDTSRKAPGFAAGIRCGDVVKCHIYDNSIHDSFGSGIYIHNNVTNAAIYRNRIFGQTYYGVYVFGNLSDHVLVYNNLIYNNLSSGITFTNTGENTRIFNNTLVDNGWQTQAAKGNAIDIYKASGEKGLQVKNNICYAPKNAQCFRLGKLVETEVDIDHNLWFTSTSEKVIYWKGQKYNLSQFVASTSHGAHSLEANPMLYEDFTISARSPAYQTGLDLSAEFIDDYNQLSRTKTWDMGAFEASLESSEEVVSE